MKDNGEVSLIDVNGNDTSDHKYGIEVEFYEYVVTHNNI